MKIVDLTMELADGTQTHPAHPRCVVIEFAGVPLRIKGATGSPIRAMAIVE